MVTSSRAVICAMVTLRSTTGWMISRIARSTATGTARLSGTRANCCGSAAFTVT